MDAVRTLVKPSGFRKFKVFERKLLLRMIKFGASKKI